MNTTRSRFHLAGSTQSLNNAPELSFASGSVQDNPSACGTRRGSADLSCSRGAGWSGASEHRVRVRTRATDLAYATARFIQEPPTIIPFGSCTAAVWTGSDVGGGASGRAILPVGFFRQCDDQHQ